MTRRDIVWKISLGVVEGGQIANFCFSPSPPPPPPSSSGLFCFDGYWAVFLDSLCGGWAGFPFGDEHPLQRTEGAKLWFLSALSVVKHLLRVPEGSHKWSQRLDLTLNQETSFQSSDQGRVKLVVDPEVRPALSVHPPETGTGLWLNPAFLLICLISSPNFLPYLALSFTGSIFLSLSLISFILGTWLWLVDIGLSTKIFYTRSLI